MFRNLHIAILAAALCPLALSPIVRAEDKPANPLDRALDDTTDNTKPAPAKPADGKAANPVDILDPDAVNALDTQDLVKKLTGAAPKGEGPEAMMKELVSRMDDSAKRLHDRDPGSLTQETQKRITTNLDQLIELVRQQQQQQGSSQSQSKSESEAQKRQRMKGSQEGPHNQGGNNAAKQSTLPGDSSVTPESNGTDIHQRSREWGNLPERERDLIVHGSKEELLPSYKEIIQRYYQSLAEINKTTRDR